MKKYTAEILIITRSIVLQQGLGALLESLPGIGTVKAIPEISRAHVWIAAHQPQIALLDMTLTGSDPRLALQKIQQASPPTQRVLLVDDVQDMKWVPQYAEAILIKGVAPSAVASIVASLLISKGEGDEHKNSND